MTIQLVKLQNSQLSSVTLTLLLLFTVFSVSTTRVNASSLVADQQCSSVGVSYLDGVGTHEPAGQTFTPTQSSVVGVSVYVYSVSSAPTPMTANIRLGGIGGAVLAAFTFSIPGGFGAPTGDWYQVQFPSGVHLTPGSTYAIDLIDQSGSSAIKWSACSTTYSGGCGYANGTCQTNSWAFIEYSGDFSVALTSSSLVLVQGSSGSVGLIVTSLSNFASPVTMSISAINGVGGSFTDNPITPTPGGTATSTLDIFVPGNIPVGNYTITVTGTSGSLSHSTTLALTVVATGVSDFAATSGPTVVLPAGATGTATIYITAFDGFDSQVGLAASWVNAAPADVTFNLPSPITPTVGGTATSTLTIVAGPTAPPGTYTLRVTAASGSLTHTVDVTLIIAPVTTITTTSTTGTPDFSIDSSSSTVSIVQGLSGSTTIIVTSLGGFSSPVTFSASWVGSSPAGVGFTLPAPITPPPGGAGSSPMGITTTSTASTGTYDLRIAGTSGTLEHSTDITVQISASGPRCIIATATYGSELAPQVQILRNYRDGAILKTKAGSAFMIAFNAWYYSFSPQVANHIANNPAESNLMRSVLYPLIGILSLSYGMFSLTRSQPEFGLLISGMLASGLIGAVYFGLPLALLRLSSRPLRNRASKRSVVRSLGVILSGAIGILAIGELLNSIILLTVASVAIVLSTVSLSAALTSIRIISCVNALNGITHRFRTKLAYSTPLPQTERN